MQTISCEHCGRYLFKQAGTVVIEEMICPNNACKARLNFKIVEADHIKDIRYKFVTPAQPPKKKVLEVS